MSDTKYIGALNLGIVGEALMNKEEKIRAILEANTPISYNADFGKYIDTDELEELKDV